MLWLPETPEFPAEFSISVLRNPKSENGRGLLQAGICFWDSRGFHSGMLWESQITSWMKNEI